MMIFSVVGKDFQLDEEQKSFGVMSRYYGWGSYKEKKTYEPICGEKTIDIS